jgi:hypothetical protein
MASRQAVARGSQRAVIALLVWVVLVLAVLVLAVPIGGFHPLVVFYRLAFGVCIPLRATPMPIGAVIPVPDFSSLSRVPSGPVGFLAAPCLVFIPFKDLRLPLGVVCNFSRVFGLGIVLFTSCVHRRGYLHAPLPSRLKGVDCRQIFACCPTIMISGMWGQIVVPCPRCRIVSSDVGSSSL